MDPLVILIVGGVLLFGSLGSLLQDLRRHQCPGCLTLSFGSQAQKRIEHSTATVYRVCRRCGCAVHAGEMDSDGTIRWNADGRGAVVAPEKLADAMRNTVPLSDDGSIDKSRDGFA